MNLHSSSSRFFHSRVIYYAAILVLALFSSSFAFCGPIHDAARRGDLKKVKALLAADPTLVSSKDKGIRRCTSPRCMAKQPLRRHCLTPALM